MTEVDYDEDGDVTRITLPDGSFLEYEYSPARRIPSVENNAGERVEYSDYDAMGNVKERTS